MPIWFPFCISCLPWQTGGYLNNWSFLMFAQSGDKNIPILLLSRRGSPVRWHPRCITTGRETSRQDLPGGEKRADWGTQKKSVGLWGQILQILPAITSSAKGEAPLLVARLLLPVNCTWHVITVIAVKGRGGRWEDVLQIFSVSLNFEMAYFGVFLICWWNIGINSQYINIFENIDIAIGFEEEKHVCTITTFLDQIASKDSRCQVLIKINNFCTHLHHIRHPLLPSQGNWVGVPRPESRSVSTKYKPYEVH